MRKCIWCNKSEASTTFINKAHTFPKSLGGGSICENVCDSCNHYFGTRQFQSPAIEIVLKEMLNISKYLLLFETDKVPKNKHFKSEYFNINWDKKTIQIKPKYGLRKGFQENLGRLFKRGIYKVFLEERERQKQDALEERFNFIREFSRYNLGDYPVYIFKPKIQGIFFSLDDIIKPMIRFTENSDKLDKQFRVFEYLIMGHYFCLPTSKIFNELFFDSYIKHLKNSDHPFGQEIVPIKKAEDIDFTFNIRMDTKTPIPSLLLKL